MYQFLSFQPAQSTGNTCRRNARPQQSFATALFFGQITQADADKTAISWLIHNLKGTAAPVPDILQRLGFLKFQGDVSGYPSRITAHGTLQSQPGQINANLTMHTDTLTQQKSYSGKVSTHNFELGKLLAKKELGKTSFDLELNGLQYRNHQPESHIKGEISSLEYNDYQYQHIALNGNFKPGGFNGHLSLDDENGKISVDGNFVTQQAVPDFNLRVKVRDFRPHKLQLTKKYEDTDVSLNLTADFSGHSIDDVQGKSASTVFLSARPTKKGTTSFPACRLMRHSLPHRPSRRKYALTPRS